jgi:hypothetical protein
MQHLQHSAANPIHDTSSSMNRNHDISENRIIRNVFLAAAPFLAVGLFACWWGMNKWSEYENMKSWVEVPAMIKMTDLEEHLSRRHHRYEVFATYEYEFNEKQYSGSRVTLLSGLMNQGSLNREAYEELNPHRVQQTPFRCYVNPNAPQESIIYRNLPGFPLVQSTVLATIPGTIGMALLTISISILMFGSTRLREQVALVNTSMRLVVFWAIIGSYWSIACLPLDRKILESISGGGGVEAWLAIMFPLIGLLMLTRSLLFAFEGPTPHGQAPESDAAAAPSLEYGV